MAVTVAPGSTPPLESATVPLICAVAWAHAAVARNRTRTLPSPIRNTRFIQPLLKAAVRRRCGPLDYAVFSQRFHRRLVQPQPAKHLTGVGAKRRTNPGGAAR